MGEAGQPGSTRKVDPGRDRSTCSVRVRRFEAARPARPPSQTYRALVVTEPADQARREPWMRNLRHSYRNRSLRLDSHSLASGERSRNMAISARGATAFTYAASSLSARATHL